MRLHQERRSSGYRPDIDGLRALAVIPVILFHAGVAGASGGYVGVDVFFVISGYLITSIIVSELEAGTFTMARFYERRIRRILPALFLVMFASVPLAMVILVPEYLEDFGQSVIAAALFVSNFFFYLEEGYFEGPADLHPLLHTWSLAVEEQYYLAIAPLMVLIARLGRRYALALGALGLASFGFGVYQVEANPSAAFYLLPARLWELMLGGLLSLGTGRIHLRAGASSLLTAMGLVLIGIAVVGFDEHTVFPGAAALVPCLGTALAIAGGLTLNPVSSFLGAAPLRAIGLISYSLYLWHFPLIVFSRHVIVRPFEPMEVTALLALTLMLAVLSWRFVEQPYRARPGRVGRRALLWGAGLSVAACVGVGLFTDLSDGAPWRLPPLAQAYLAAEKDKDTSCMRRLENCELGPADAEPQYLLWGDSHASAILPAFRALSNEIGVAGKAALRGGCLPLLGYRLEIVIAESCAAHVEATFRELIGSDIGTVFLAARWTMVVEESMYGYESGRPLMLLPAVEGAGSGSDRTSNSDVLAASLDETLAALRTAGKRVVLIGPIPEVGWHVPDVLAQRARFGTWFDSTAIAPTLADFEVRNRRTLALLENAAAAHGATLVRPHLVFCTAGERCKVQEGDRPLYYDTDHLTLTGAGLLTDLLRSLIQGEEPVRRNPAGEQDPQIASPHPS